MNFAKDKSEMLRIVVECAEKFEHELLNREFLVLFDNRKEILSFEFRFNRNNFLHLTGLKLLNNITANDFYDRCRNHRLSINDFDAAADGTTQLKLEILPQIINKNLSAKMIGDYNSSLPKLYTEKLVGGEKACIGFVCDNITKCFVPNTLLKTDIRSLTYTVSRVVAVLRKNEADDHYNEVTYIAKNIKLADLRLPPQFDYLKAYNDLG